MRMITCLSCSRIAGWCPSSRRHSTNVMSTSFHWPRGELSCQHYLSCYEWNFVGWYGPLNSTVLKLSGVFRLLEMTANNQATQDLKEQMELKRLYANCDQVILHSKVFYQKYVEYKHSTGIGKYWGTHISVYMPVEVEKNLCLVGFVPCSSFQDLEFASRLVKQSQVSAEVLMETIRLLLPTLPESELLSITDALCPKQHPISSSAEQEHIG